MPRLFSSSPRKAWITALAPLVSLCAGFANAQNLAVQATDLNPLRLGDFNPLEDNFDLGLTGAVKGEFNYGVNTSAAYNSNLNLSDTDEASDISFVVVPRIRYNSDPEGGAKFTITAKYAPRFIGYIDNTDLNKIDQSGDLALEYQAVRTNIALFARYSELSGSDILTGGYTEGALFIGGLRINRRVATRTSIYGGITVSQSDYNSTVDQGSEIYAAYIGGFWNASPHLRLGPTLRVSHTESANTGNRDAFALLAEARFQAGDRTWLTLALGPEFGRVDGPNGNDSINLSADITASYAINNRWAWTNSLLSATIPSPNQTDALVNDVVFRSALRHQLLRGTVSGGVSLRWANYEDAGGTTTAARDDEYTTGVFVNYRRPLGSERIAFEGTARYAFNDGLVNWKQFVATLGLDIRF